MASFGAQLKREREQRKISLDDISVSTKIGTRFLRAIEENQFDQLPGGIFNKGFVRAYARHLGLNEEQAIADYLEATRATAVETKPEGQATMPEPVTQRENGAAQIPWGTLAILLLVLAMGLASWNFYSRDKTLNSEPRAETPAAQRESSNLRPTVSTQPIVSNAPSGEPVAQAPAAGSFAVLLKARDESWISAATDGNAPAEQTLLASNEKLFEARSQLTLRIGNVGAIDVYFNGQKLAPQGEEGEVKTLSFNAQGLQVSPKPIPAASNGAPQ